MSKLGFLALSVKALEYFKYFEEEHKLNKYEHQQNFLWSKKVWLMFRQSNINLSNFIGLKGT